MGMRWDGMGWDGNEIVNRRTKWKGKRCRGCERRRKRNRNGRKEITGRRNVNKYIL